MDTTGKPDRYRGAGELGQKRPTGHQFKESTMNRYSLSSDSDRWWYPTAIAGTIGAAAVTAIFIAPVIGAQAYPIQSPAGDSAVPGGSGPVVLIDRPCYLARAGWNTPAGWEQPVCTTEIRRGAEGPALGTRRAPADYLP
jgi:hypothetical protein